MMAMRMYFILPIPVVQKENPAVRNLFDSKRSVIQLTELVYENDELTCDRDKPVLYKIEKIIF